MSAGRSCSTIQLIAMHGWCGDRRSWDPWLPLWRQRGWSCCCGERGYGNLPPLQPGWSDAPGLKVVIAHSLGPHLLMPDVLAAADALVLLTSFGRFVPSGQAGRGVSTALAAMDAQLAGQDPQPMLETFLQRVAAPAASELLQATPAREPLPPEGLQRLRDDLALISQCNGLPAGFPREARVLLVQAGCDQIVVAKARLALEAALPAADVVRFSNAGHGLLGTPVVTMAGAWLDALVQP